MKEEFTQIRWDQDVADDCRQIVRLAVREDLGRSHDLTTLALVARSAHGAAQLVTREPGIVAGLPVIDVVLTELNLQVVWQPAAADGDEVAASTRLGKLAGSSRDLLTAERLLLNLVSRLSGVATLTRKYVDAVKETTSRIYDTRKTTPGYRRLEKYAVRCGGGTNHRTGLFDALLIKDNHLAQAAVHGCSPREAVVRGRSFLQQQAGDEPCSLPIIEVEVDTLEQFDEALLACPNIVLLDNMTMSELREAVRRRDTRTPEVELEASGGITLDTIRQVAETGVNRISVGALTHAATSLDIGLDWD